MGEKQKEEVRNGAMEITKQKKVENEEKNERKRKKKKEEMELQGEVTEKEWRD